MASAGAMVRGTLAYLVSTFAGGFIWHITLFQQSYLDLKVWSKFDDPSFAFGVAAIVTQGLLISHLMPIYLFATGRGGVRGGARLGLWMGACVFSVAVLAHSAKNTITCWEGFAILEGAYCLVQFPLSGAAVAAAQRRGAAAAGKKSA